MKVLFKVCLIHSLFTIYVRYDWKYNKKSHAIKYKNDKRHGLGTYTHSNGEKYVGEYKNNKRHGFAIYTFANGEKKVGEWKNGNYVGK